MLGGSDCALTTMGSASEGPVTPQTGHLWVENPEVAEVLDLQTGQHQPHSDVIGTDYAAAIRLRSDLQTGIRRGAPRLACSMCGAPVYLVSQAAERRFFFRHTLEDGRCSAKTRGELSQDEIDARKYNGVKESEPHRRMKDWIARCLQADSRFSDVQLEARWTKELTGEWRRPDVRARLGELSVAFEVQLSTAHLNVVVARRDFYLREGGLLVWVFANFDAGARRLTFDDIFYNNNQNAFLVNERTVAASLERGEFLLECLWVEPLAGGRVTPLKRAVVPFHKLTLDQGNQQAFYFNYHGVRHRLDAEEAEALEGPRKALRDRFEAYWMAVVGRDLEPPDLVEWRSLRADFARTGVALPAHPENLPTTLLKALYSAKHGRPVGWRHSRLIEIAHWVALAHREHLRMFRRALAVYDRADQLLTEDKTGKWRKRVSEYRVALAIGDPAYEPNTRYAKLIAVLFPELNPSQQALRRQGYLFGFCGWLLLASGRGLRSGFATRMPWPVKVPVPGVKPSGTIFPPKKRGVSPTR